MPSQQIGPVPDEIVRLVDQEQLSESERAAAFEREARAELHRPFDLAVGPVIRVTLLRHSATDHSLLVALHHIAGDAWSLGLLRRELASLYDAFTSGLPSPLPELKVQYADFAHWQRDALRAGALDASLEYWRRQLGDLPELEFPADHRRPELNSFKGSSVRAPVPEHLAHAARLLGRETGATLSMVLLGAFNTLLHHVTGQCDLVVGSPVAGHDRIETEDLIGIFVNTLVMRTDVSGDPTFRLLLERVRNVALEAYTHRDARSTLWRRSSSRVRWRTGTRCSRCCSHSRTRRWNRSSWRACASPP